MVPGGLHSPSGGSPEGLGTRLGFQGGVAVIAAAVGAWLLIVGARLDSGTCAGSGPGLGRRAAGCLCIHRMRARQVRDPPCAGEALTGEKQRVGKVWNAHGMEPCVVPLG